MQRSMKKSYRRTFRFLKKHFLSVLIMCLVLFIVFLAMIISQQIAGIIIYGLTFVVFILIGAGIALTIEGGGIAILGIVLIVLGGLLALASLVIMIMLMVLMGSIGFGIQILLSELLLKLKHEGRITWKDTWDLPRSASVTEHTISFSSISMVS